MSSSGTRGHVIFVSQSAPSQTQDAVTVCHSNVLYISATRGSLPGIQEWRPVQETEAFHHSTPKLSVPGGIQVYVWQSVHLITSHQSLHPPTQIYLCLWYGSLHGTTIHLVRVNLEWRWMNRALVRCNVLSENTKTFRHGKDGATSCSSIVELLYYRF